MAIGASGQTLELFYIDGRPDGMLTAELHGWTGHLLMTPRTQLIDALERKESSYTGVYLLFGERESGVPVVYIGKSGNIGDRIRTQDAKLDWWTSAILITSAANKLITNHAEYLEARLIVIAKDIGKIALENTQTPTLPGLSEATKANMETFLENILMVLPALSIDSFVKSTRPGLPPGPSDDDPDAPWFELRVPRNQIHATARLIDGEFVVQAGSLVAKAWNGPARAENGTYDRLYSQLVKAGRLPAEGKHRVFKENYAFKSASAAASVVNGHPVAGPIVWKVKGQKKTYKQWESERLMRQAR